MTGDSHVSCPEQSPQRRGIFGLLCAVAVSQLGTRMSFLAVPWFVLAVTGSPTITGVVAFTEMAPYVGVQALAGPWLDRIGTWRVSVGSDLGAAAAVGAVPVLHATDSLTVPVLSVLVAIAGGLRGGGDTARDVLLPGVAGAAGTPLERAAGLYDGASRLAALIGAPLAGVLITVSSSATVLAVDAITFLLSALTIATLVSRSAQPQPAPQPESGPLPPPGYVASLAEGFRYLRDDRLLLGIATMVLVTNTLDQAQGAVLAPVWATTIAHSAVSLGLIGGAFALGAVLGNIGVAWFGPRAPRRLTYGVGFLLAGAPRFIALALASTVSPVLPVTLAAGLGAGGINPILGAVEYERIPRALQARVLGAMGATAWAGIPIGSLAGGALVERLGLRPTLWLTGTIYLAATLSPFIFPAWRGMARTRPEPNPN